MGCALTRRFAVETGAIACAKGLLPALRLGFQLCGNGMDRSAFLATGEILVNNSTLGGLVEMGRKHSQFGFDFALISSGDGSIQFLLLRLDSGEN